MASAPILASLRRLLSLLGAIAPFLCLFFPALNTLGGFLSLLGALVPFLYLCFLALSTFALSLCPFAVTCLIGDRRMEAPDLPVWMVLAPLCRTIFQISINTTPSSLFHTFTILLRPSSFPPLPPSPPNHLQPHSMPSLVLLQAWKFLSILPSSSFLFLLVSILSFPFFSWFSLLLTIVVCCGCRLGCCRC